MGWFETYICLVSTVLTFWATSAFRKMRLRVKMKRRAFKRTSGDYKGRNMKDVSSDLSLKFTWTQTSVDEGTATFRVFLLTLNTNTPTVLLKEKKRSEGRKRKKRRRKDSADLTVDTVRKYDLRANKDMKCCHEMFFVFSNKSWRCWPNPLPVNNTEKTLTWTQHLSKRLCSFHHKHQRTDSKDRKVFAPSVSAWNLTGCRRRRDSSRETRHHHHDAALWTRSDGLDELQEPREDMFLHVCIPLRCLWTDLQGAALGLTLLLPLVTAASLNHLLITVRTPPAPPPTACS